MQIIVGNDLCVVPPQTKQQSISNERTALSSLDETAVLLPGGGIYDKRVYDSEGTLKPVAIL